MFERFNEAARRSLFFARYEAIQRQSPAIAPEHLLVGAARVRTGLMDRVLAAGPASLETLQTRLRGLTPSTPAGTASHVEIPFTQATKSCLQFAADEADRLGHTQIGPEHLLLGILRVPTSAAAAVLADMGLPLEGLRTLVRERHDVPSAPGVRLSRSTRPLERGTSSHRDQERWTIEGFGLRGLLAQVYGMPGSRVVLPDGRDDDETYDCEAVAAPDAPPSALNQLMQDGIERHFQMSITRETRDMNVYVVTAPNGIKAPRHPSPSGGALGAISFSTSDVGPLLSGALTDEEAAARMTQRLRRMIAGGTTDVGPFQRFSSSGDIDSLCRALEGSLGRPVINDTADPGSYDLAVRSSAHTIEESLAALADQTGLVATPARRQITLLVARAR